MKGILFKEWKVNAIRTMGTDREWQTRRVMKPQPVAGDEPRYDGKCAALLQGDWYKQTTGPHAGEVSYAPWYWRPKYLAGEVVYVKERYDPAVWPDCKPWKSPLFMPAVAARTLLLITGVRVERTSAISWQDCIAEGVVQSPQWLEFNYEPPENLRPGILTPDEAEAEIDRAWQEYVRQAYFALFDSINGPGAHDCWVWVYEFRRVEGDHLVDANKMVGDKPCGGEA